MNIILDSFPMLLVSFLCVVSFFNVQFARDKIVLKPLQTALTNYLKCNIY